MTHFEGSEGWSLLKKRVTRVVDDLIVMEMRYIKIKSFLLLRQLLLGAFKKYLDTKRG